MQKENEFVISNWFSLFEAFDLFVLLNSNEYNYCIYFNVIGCFYLWKNKIMLWSKSGTSCFTEFFQNNIIIILEKKKFKYKQMLKVKTEN